MEVSSDPPLQMRMREVGGVSDFSKIYEPELGVFSAEGSPNLEWLRQKAKANTKFERILTK